MPAYEVSVWNSEESDESYSVLLQAANIINVIMLVLTLTALIYAVVSWRIMKKFRDYKNFVFLNLILVNFLLYSLRSGMEYAGKINISWVVKMIHMFKYYIILGNHYWLVVTTYMFYVEFVKVFNGHIKMKFLKSCLFGWGMPFISLGLIYHLSMLEPENYTVAIIIRSLMVLCAVLPSILNCAFYIKIIVDSVCFSNTGAHTASGKCRRLCLSTVIFIFSDVIFVSLYTLFIFVDSLGMTVIFLDWLFIQFIVLVLDVFIVLSRSNRELWYEYNANRLSQSSLPGSNEDRGMHERIRRKPDDSEAAVPDS